jgi:alpha-beta hydrolase superfamily lysophospholipase
MIQESLSIGSIPAIAWGDRSERAYIFVHGKMSRKEEAAGFAEIAARRGWQTLSFDLPEHGERQSARYTGDDECVPWNGARDLLVVGDWARRRWSHLALCATSLGAYFSLLAYPDFPLERCLFISPILDMERLIDNMMGWFGVSVAELEARGEVPTPMGETLSWKYRQYAREHRVERWPWETRILYAERDNLTERAVLDGFAARFGCAAEVVPAGEHYFHTPAQVAALTVWLERNA